MTGLLAPQRLFMNGRTGCRVETVANCLGSSDPVFSDSTSEIFWSERVESEAAVEYIRTDVAREAVRRLVDQVEDMEDQLRLLDGAILREAGQDVDEAAEDAFIEKLREEV